MTTWATNDSESKVADFDQVEKILRSSYYNICWKYSLTSYFKELNLEGKKDGKEYIPTAFATEVKKYTPVPTGKKSQITFSSSKHLRYVHTPYALPVLEDKKSLQKTKKIAKKVGKK